MRRLLGTGATFVARCWVGQLNHMTEMMERAMRHDGFSVVEVLTNCVEFFDNAYDAVNPRKGGRFEAIAEKRYDDTSEDAARHDVRDLDAAFRLASKDWPGVFGIYYEAHTPTKNAREAKLILAEQERNHHADDLSLLRASLQRMK
jgi:2-oxoglutarate ferredoxin oxidoreductase subunit beta